MRPISFIFALLSQPVARLASSHHLRQRTKLIPTTSPSSIPPSTPSLGSTGTNPTLEPHTLEPTLESTASIRSLHAENDTSCSRSCYWCDYLMGDWVGSYGRVNDNVIMESPFLVNITLSTAINGTLQLSAQVCNNIHPEWLDTNLTTFLADNGAVLIAGQLSADVIITTRMGCDFDENGNDIMRAEDLFLGALSAAETFLYDKKANNNQTNELFIIQGPNHTTLVLERPPSPYW